MRLTRPFLGIAILLLEAAAAIFIVAFVAEHVTPLMVWSAGAVIALLASLLLVLRAFRRRKFLREQQRIPPATLTERDHPVLGKYIEIAGHRMTGWRCNTFSEVLRCKVRLNGNGLAPTDAQLERWHDIERRLPDILAGIPPPPEDDGWGLAPGDFTPSKPRHATVYIGADLGFMVFADLISSDDYKLAPLIKVTPDGTVSFDGWAI